MLGLTPDYNRLTDLGAPELPAGRRYRIVPGATPERAAVQVVRPRRAFGWLPLPAEVCASVIVRDGSVGAVVRAAVEAERQWRTRRLTLREQAWQDIREQAAER